MATYASLGERLGALIIDVVGIIILTIAILIVGSIIFTIIVLILAVISEELAGLVGALMGMGMMIGFFLLPFSGLLYYIVLEGPKGGGQTFGKKMLGIKVTTEDGGVPSYGAAAIRNILRIIDGLFMYLVGAALIHTSDKNQRLGDTMAKTIVVKV